MISTFLKSSSHNLKYVGIDGLARIVRINPKYAAEHQLAVIDCLEDPDDMLKKKTLELLYKMTKPNNVEVSSLWFCNACLVFALSPWSFLSSLVTTGIPCRGLQDQEHSMQSVSYTAFNSSEDMRSAECQALCFCPESRNLSDT